ncbi:MAG TPA: hypothetical protein VNU64_11525 [Burkholderiales bacterium]|nr:hypothetical protein [Burkholderiales bacterium]
MKTTLLALALAVLAGCSSIASQGGSAPDPAPQDNFSYPRSPNFA